MDAKLGIELTTEGDEIETTTEVKGTTILILAAYAMLGRKISEIIKKPQSFVFTVTQAIIDKLPEDGGNATEIDASKLITAALDTKGGEQQ